MSWALVVHMKGLQHYIDEIAALVPQRAASR